MEKNIELANKYAKGSCSRWNKRPAKRIVYRKKYRKLAEKYYKSDTHQALISKNHNGGYKLNTYPWPYCDYNFADWDESDDPDDYTLISDQSNCVIRYSTSYCAYKIFETTGEWPQKKTKKRLDSKNWVQFLSEAGYNYIVGPEEVLNSQHCYVGVNPDFGEWGLAVWAELGENQRTHEALVSSYVEKEYKFWEINTKDFTWVKIK